MSIQVHCGIRPSAKLMKRLVLIEGHAGSTLAEAMHIPLYCDIDAIECHHRARGGPLPPTSPVTKGPRVEKWPRDSARRDDARAPKRVKARVISSSLRS